MRGPRGSLLGSRDDRFPRWPIVAVLVLATIVRLWHLGARSLWTDEGSTWTAAMLRFGDLLRRCVERDASPPLYYLLTAIPLRMEQDETHLRLVSALASLVMVWLGYRLARLAAGRGEATFAALLVALSPLQVMYAQEARTYALVACGMTASLLLFARAVLHGRRRAWLPYVLVTTLALYTQSIAMLGLLAQAALVGLTLQGRRRAAPWFASMAAVGVLYVPWMWASASMAKHLGSSHWYVDSLDPHGVFHVLRSVLLSPLSLVSAVAGGRTPGLDALIPRPLAWLLLVAAVALPLGATLADLPRHDARGRAIRLAWAGWLLPLLAVVVVSIRSPLFLSRYFVFVTPPLAMLLARGVFVQRPAVLRRIWGGALVLISVYALWRYDRDYTKEPWRDVVADVGARGAPGRTAALVPFDLDPFAFYNRRLPQPVAAFEFSHPAEPFAAAYTDTQLVEMQRTAEARTATFDEVWVVIRSPNSAIRREAAARAESVAVEGRSLAERRQWDSVAGPLRVARYVRVAPPAEVPPPATRMTRRRSPR